MLGKKLSGATIWCFIFLFSTIISRLGIITHDKAFIIAYLLLIVVIAFWRRKKECFTKKELISYLIIGICSEFTFAYIASLLVNIDFYVAFQLVSFGSLVSVNPE